MTLPTSKLIRRPLLDFLRDEKVHSLDETIRHLAGHFDLTEDDKNIQTPGGRPLFSNRVIRAVSALRISGLLENESLARFKITGEGVRASQSSDDDLHEALQSSARRPPQAAPPDPDDHSELMRFYASSLDEDLKSDLLKHISQCSPGAFETLVKDLLVKMGYGGLVKDAGRVVGGPGDRGIDIIIKEDELGLRKIHVQAKRWTGNVGDVEVKKFLGSMVAEKSDLGIIITTSDFTQQARETCKKSPKSLVLIDGRAMAGYMVSHGLGVSVIETHKVQEIDARFFSRICGIEAA